jgi:hypothetical protein
MHGPQPGGGREKEFTMVVERLVFQVKYGKDLVSVAKKGEKIFTKHGLRRGRLLTDLTGDMFTVVWENEWENLAEFEKARARMFDIPEFHSWFSEMEAVTEHGHRELWNVE